MNSASFMYATTVRRLSAVAMVALSTSTACSGNADSTTGPDSHGSNTNQNATPTSLGLSTSLVRLGAIGASEQVIAIVQDAAGGRISGVILNWSSTDITVADVSGTGTTAVITARAPGHATVRAQVGKLMREMDVYVLAVRAIVITPGRATIRAGDQIALSAALDADDGVLGEIRWASDNPAVATVAADGTVTGVTTGNAVIRATATADTRINSTILVTVTPSRSLRVDGAPSVMWAGDAVTLTAQLDVDSTQSRGVRWSSSEITVAAVSDNGIVTAIRPGSTTVRAVAVADQLLQDSVRIEIRAARTVTISPSAVSLAGGETRILSAQVAIEDGLSRAVTWRSHDTAIATVSVNGIITGISRGSTTITATSVADTSRRGIATVTVVPIVRDIDVSPGAVSMNGGETRQLTATLSADAGASRTIVWRSANPSIASVSETGLVTAGAPGATTITAMALTDSTKRATSLITVRSAPVVTVSPTALSLGLGQRRTIVAMVTAGIGVTTAVTWRSGNSAIATVDSDGSVTAVGFGTAVVTATSVADTTRWAAATLTVVPRVQSVSVSPSTATIQTGQTVQLIPSVVAQGALSTAVTYRSSDPAVAVVSPTGLVTATGSGISIITVMSAADTTVTASSAITVTIAPPQPLQLVRSWSAGRLGGALHEDVISVAAIDGSTIFAVNSRGNVYSFDGSSWTMSLAGASYGTRFSAVSASSATNVIAVGSNGVIARFNGSSWTTMASGTGQDLAAVFMESSTTGFAVGVNGTALRFNGTSWNALSTPVIDDLLSVWSSVGVAYAVGTAGVVLRFDGLAWTRQTSRVSETLYGVTGSSSDNVLAVGAFGTIIRFDGQQWSAVPNAGLTGDLLGVTVSRKSAGVFFAASDDGLLVLNGSALSVWSTPYAPRFFSVAQDATGRVVAGGQRGITMRSDASGTWETLSAAPDLIDAWTTGVTNTWVVGELGFIHRWNGTDWSRQITPTTSTLNTVWGSGLSAGFAGGDDGTMLKWNGSTWTQMAFPSNASVYGLWGTGPDNVYAVTSAGEVMRYDGSMWSVVTSASGPLWSVFGSSASDVYISGENGIVLRFNGTNWSSLDMPLAGTIAGIWTGGAGRIVAVTSGPPGNGGVAYRMNGTTWNAMNTGTSRVLTSVWGPDIGDLYATGDAGTMLRFNGSSWNAMNSSTSDLLWAVTGTPGGGSATAFAVGYNSTLLTGTGDASIMAAVRSSTLRATSSLNPSRGARTARVPLPSGKARRYRKGS